MLRARTPSLGSATTSKTVWIKISGVWNQAVFWIKISGVWKQSIPGVKVSGIWK